MIAGILETSSIKPWMANKGCQWPQRTWETQHERQPASQPELNNLYGSKNLVSRTPPLKLSKYVPNDLFSMTNKTFSGWGSAWCVAAGESERGPPRSGGRASRWQCFQGPKRTMLQIFLKLNSNSYIGTFCSCDAAHLYV